jgi:cysteine synthase
MIAKRLSDLVGNTPILELDQGRYDIPENVHVLLKMESMNPGTSVKDRTVSYMFDKLEESGELLPGGTVIDANAGNTGVALAWVGAERGYKIVLVLPEDYIIEKQIMCRALGAEIIHVPCCSDHTETDAAVNKYRSEHPDAYYFDQYENPLNMQVHYEVTGPELYSQLDGKIDIFMHGAGTGGTFTGVAKYLKEQNLATQAIIVQPEGSVYSGGKFQSFTCSGIGNSFIPGNLDLSLADEIVDVNQQQIDATLWDVAKKSGLLIGQATGAHVYAAIRKAKTMAGAEETNIVVMATDDSWKYFTKNIFDTCDWMEAKNRLVK